MGKRLQPFRLFLIGALLAGCSTQPAQKEPKAKPELTIQVASMNLAAVNKRLEKSDVKKIADLVKREQIEILSVQAITRYPGVTTRVDFVDELAKQGDLNSAFGEMVNNSGRQTGNAVFSTYPIRSKSNQAFENIKSVKFEAALQAVIDGGTRSLYIVSAQLPALAPSEEKDACIRAVSAANKWERNDAVILTGNLPNPAPSGGYLDVQSAGSKQLGTRIWYSPNESLQLIGVRSVETELGPMLVAQFGVFRQMQP